ncbi:hypothetical protein M0R45_025289 [Rubus argutus]|uniref:NB-ARC domain-containing protein n=1 Tax=Rubus argutus TaxID=59490 RepID=A0AAW1WXS9_RUBAR
MNSNKLKATIKNLLQKRRYLIVLDDVWHINEWETVKYAFPTGKLGSRVMITTRKSDVAFTSCSESEGNVYEKDLFEAKEGRTLEEVAEDYLKELLNRNLMLVGDTTSDGRVKTYRIHDLLREISVSKSKGSKLCSDSEGTRHNLAR